MSATTSRLQEVQAVLVKRGVRDVKFFFAFSPIKAISEVADDAAKLLNAFLERKGTLVKRVDGRK